MVGHCGGGINHSNSSNNDNNNHNNDRNERYFIMHINNTTVLLAFIINSNRQLDDTYISWKWFLSFTS